MVTQDERREPSQISGQITSAAGQVQQAIASVVPSALGGDALLQGGQNLTKSGQLEVDDAKRKKALESTIDSGVGKAKSALGYVTGDQSQQTRGNQEAERAQWDYKQATSSSAFSVPVPSEEGLKGKLQSVQGMVTGNQELQKEGNARAEKAAWKDGV
ncbi:hypothetical protein I316_01533 [Kwoniella heveanensis BCC8398]|uniref:CsbD-like domain-containing protein n=1 Tax=Kwoniella heveanensis BCC8398 TaxID=1296120 RepID=A0A1B9H0Z0_9TREE|nr:hypothetical protein I316_01533 [Kwoniella heveanensis BCC8398]